ncbi:MAG: hypothetical protein GY729_03590 [Desulfobacteraceae bacterium]|nr:hypothetical protein [Desulfobacteraceae bacterium]
MKTNKFHILKSLSIIVISIVLVFILISRSHANRTIQIIRGLTHDSGKMGKYYALIIGIQNYRDPNIPDLETPLNDTKVISDLLKQKYGFKVDMILDSQATKKAIYNKLRQVASKASIQDSVLIYYAGHGDYDRQYDDGWWIPVDAKGGDPVTYLDNIHVQKAIRAMKAKHVLLISDSCYSGTLFGQARAMPPVINDKFYLNLYNEKSRWGMTSGNKTPVSDSGTAGHSVFAYQLIKKFKTNDRPYLSVQEIYADIAPIIGNNSEQTPICRPIRNTGDQGGAFIFVKLNTSNAIAKKIEEPEPVVLPDNKAAAFDDILNVSKQKRDQEKKWNHWQKDRETEYAQVNLIDKDKYLTIPQKKEAWYRFLQVLAKDNPFSTKDNEMKQYAVQRMEYWEAQISKGKDPKKVAALSPPGKPVKPALSHDYYDQFIPAPVWPKVGSGKNYHWKLVSVFPKNFPLLGANFSRFARIVEKKSNGRLSIKVYGANELVPISKVFDAVSKGTAQAGGSFSYLWTRKIPEAVWFTSAPFGMNTQGMLQWLHQYGGLTLWEEIYKEKNLIPRPVGTTHFQMGGWFNNKIESLQDLKGLKMRIPGLGGRVMAKAGVNVISVPGDKIFSQLENKTIDATEWLGPYHDLKMGFYKVAKYYYYPGWQEPGGNLELIFNRDAYTELPIELQSVIDQAALDCERWVIKQFEKKNQEAFKELIQDHGVNVQRFPDSVLYELRKISNMVCKEVASRNATSKKVFMEYRRVQAILGRSGSSHENAYYSR